MGALNANKSFYESVHLLRGVSALIVLFAHNFGMYKLPGLDIIINTIDRVCNPGQVGVTIFFVISGFVLPLSLMKKYDINDFNRFLIERFIRIEPTYIVSIAISVAILIVKTRLAPNAVPYNFEINRFIYHLFYLIPFTDYPWFNEVYWTLAIEFQFYLIIAILFPLWNIGINYQIIIALFVSGLFFISDFFPQVGFLSQAPFFGAGMLSISALKMNSILKKNITFLLAVSILILQGFTNGIYDNCAAAIFTIACIIWWNAPQMRISYFGTISYSLYVTHYPIITLTNQTAMHFFGSEGHPVLYVVAFANFIIAFLVADVLFKYVEQPTQKLSKKIKYRKDLLLAKIN